MESSGKLTLRRLVSLALSYKMGKAGAAMLLVMLVLSAIALLTLPLNYGTSVWTNAGHWTDTPRMVPPAWYRTFDPSLVPQDAMSLNDPTSTRAVNSAGAQVPADSYSFTYLYTYPDFPQSVKIGIHGLVAYDSSRPVLLTISLTRPDGEVNPLYFEPISIPASQTGVLLFSPDAKSIDMYGNGRVASQMSHFYESEYGVLIAPSDLSGYAYGSQKALFSTPSAGNLVPLNGAYRFTVSIQLTSPRDSVQQVSLTVVGDAYGLMGTDFQGRDLAQGLLFGFPIALLIGVVTSLLATSIGTILGVISGYYGRIIEEFVQRSADLFGNIPTLPLLILLTFVIPSNLRIPTLVAVLVIFGWPGLCIIVRSMVISIRSEPFVEAAQAIGASSRRVVFKHVLPQVVPYAVAQLIFFVPGAILTEAAISVLGLGDPNLPTWGQILSKVLDTGAVAIAWWWFLPPGLLIVFASLTFVFIALAIEPVVDPRLRRR